jgi:hypothetical protein
LALRADIAVYVFPITVAKIALASGHSGVLSLTWSGNGNGPRRVETLALKQEEIDRLLAAMNRADFWRLPHQGGHVGPADGVVATVEVAASGHKNNVTDAIGDSEAVDLSILVRTISAIIGAHWKNVPVGH